MPVDSRLKDAIGQATEHAPSVRRAADVIGSAGPGRSRHFRGQTRYERRSRSPVESQSCSNGHLRSGEGAPSATAGDRGFPHRARGEEVAGAQGPGTAGFALHPDLQLMAQPDRALVQGLNDKRLRRACSPVSPSSPRRSPSGQNTGTPTGSRSYGKPPRNRSSPKSDADVKPSTGLKLGRTTRPPGSHLGGPGLRRRHGELVALDDVREPFGLRHWDFIAVRKLDDF
jgi:hypothetical protein